MRVVKAGLFQTIFRRNFIDFSANEKVQISNIPRTIWTGARQASRAVVLSEDKADGHRPAGLEIIDPRGGGRAGQTYAANLIVVAGCGVHFGGDFLRRLVDFAAGLL